MELEKIIIRGRIGADKFEFKYSEENRKFLKDNLGNEFYAKRTCKDYYTLENGFLCHVYECFSKSVDNILPSFKHTKGDWKVVAMKSGNYGKKFKVCIPNYYPNEDLNICIISQRSIVASMQYEPEANAKLIAASPDLLRACMWAKEQFKILADKGLYPEHLLNKNGGEGIMPLTNAISKAIQ